MLTEISASIIFCWFLISSAILSWFRLISLNSSLEEIDKFIGNKIYSLRLAKGLSRQQLSKVIGVTHQQLQKYEKGT